MLRLYFILVISLCIQGISVGQSFSVKVNRDSILIGNTFEITFECTEVNGKFEGPDFKNCDIVSGPNTSMSTQIINDNYSFSKKISYYIKPTIEGQINIAPAYLILEEETLETPPLEINVYPNPEGIIQDSPRQNNNFFFDFYESPRLPKEQKDQPKKPKRKLKRL